MTRRHFAFTCGGATLVATLDEAPGTTGLLIVTGGNEVRAGAWNGQALLAARIAARGFPVLRFDRRGTGDSGGENSGFRSASMDIAAALPAFREAAPHLTRIIAFGNCDAASALMLGEGCGCDGLILANPWTRDEPGGAPTPAELKAHYARRLGSPMALLRLITGKVSLGRLFAGLREALRPTTASALAIAIGRGLARFDGRTTILLAGRDATARAFLANWDAADPRLRFCPEASHSFVEADAQIWEEDQIVTALSQDSG